MGKKLKTILKKNSGRSNIGQVTVRHQGGRQKRFLRRVDFKRDKQDMEAQVVAVEYDPNRNTQIALLSYPNGEKTYILRPEGLNVGDSVISSENGEIKVGNSLPLAKIPIGTAIHNIEVQPFQGGKLVRGAGGAATIIAKEDKYAHVKMPSGEVRKILLRSRATIGQLGNIVWKEHKFGKAGKRRLIGIRPTVRGIAQNPRSHPHGGGEGRSGIGMPAPKTYAGRAAVGKTRKKGKYSDKYIISRRKR
ncbi:50S ribosomal protein L2 [Candidatus Microgenomates bacterium]|nr:50S ribosomal protein L2 [Candidatus Microgenomates bacterium]